MTAATAFAIVTVAGLISAALMWMGVKDTNYELTAWSAAGFVAIAVITGLLMNRWLRTSLRGSGTEGQLQALRRNAQYCALAYAWGAAALVAMYKFTGLYWQHGLQYATGLLLLGAVVFGWTRLAQPGSTYATPAAVRRAAQLNAVHGGIAFVAATIFLVSGKLWVQRPDWAANIVFLAGGFSIVSLCAMAAYTHNRLGNPAI